MVRFIPAALKCRSERCRAAGSTAVLRSAGSRAGTRRRRPQSRTPAGCGSPPRRRARGRRRHDGRRRRGRRRRQGHLVPPVRQPGGSDDGAAGRGRTRHPAGVPVRSAAAGARCAAAGSAGGLRPGAVALRPHPPRTVVGGQPRPADPLRPAVRRAAPPRAGAAGRGAHHRRPRRPGRRAAGAARRRLCAPPDQRPRPHPADVGRRVGKPGAQAVR
ncbi:TetR family transcriptional regulator [Mycobacterium avium subsp. paratuberculosis S5]|nr:TetR family transcriptional regulator [Mycobacterium avium subsp. paratuberculosis S5]